MGNDEKKPKINEDIEIPGDINILFFIKWK